MTTITIVPVQSFPGRSIFEVRVAGAPQGLTMTVQQDGETVPGCLGIPAVSTVIDNPLVVYARPGRETSTISVITVEGVTSGTVPLASYDYPTVTGLDGQPQRLDAIVDVDVASRSTVGHVVAVQGLALPVVVESLVQGPKFRLRFITSGSFPALGSQFKLRLSSRVNPNGVEADGLWMAPVSDFNAARVVPRVGAARVWEVEVQQVVAPDMPRTWILTLQSVAALGANLGVLAQWPNLAGLATAGAGKG